MKKFAALLTTVLVMAMSVTSVFAAGSPSVAGAPKPAAAKTDSGVAVTIGEVTGVSEQSANEAAQAALSTVPGNVTSAQVAAYADISVPEGTIVDENHPITITLTVAGVTPNTNVLVRNFNGSAWVDCPATAGNGTVTLTTTHLSPIMVITYEVAAAGDTGNTGDTDDSDGNGYWYPYTDDETGTTPASPKTGVLPVAAIAAGICLAGAAVFGKKSKIS